MINRTELADAVVSVLPISNTNCALGLPAALSVSAPVIWAEEEKL